MVSVGMSKLGVTDLMIFVDTGAKVNGAYYRDACAPATAAVANDADVSAEFFVFQQDSAPAHRARDTVRLLELDFDDIVIKEFKNNCFIPPELWPPNSPDLNTVGYKISSSECISYGCTTLTNSSSVWCMFGTASTRPSLDVFVIVCGRRADTEQML